MPASIHISQARRILDEHRPVEVAAWKKDGSIIHIKKAMPMAYDYKNGTRNFKAMESGQIRKIREAAIFMINGLEVYL